METMLPKLVAEDIPLLNSLLQDVFPNVIYRHDRMQALRKEIKKVCEEMYLMYGENEETGKSFHTLRQSFSSLPAYLPDDVVKR